MPCEDCNGTGLIEVESTEISRGYMLNGKYVHDVIGKGNWHMAQCPCVGETDVA